MSEEKPKVDVNVVQVVASALAAVSSAVLLSTVGVAGTVIGAAVGSVIATVGSAVYSYSLQASRDRVAAAAQLAASARIRRTGPDRTETRQLPAQDELEQPPAEAGRAPWRETLSGLPWKRIAMVTAGVFAAAMVVIVSFELVAGRSLSDVTHGTTGQGHRTSLGFGASDKPSRTPTKAPTSSSSPTPTPSTSETPDVSASPSPTTTPSETATSPTPTETPSEAPTPTGTPSPSAADTSPTG